MSLQSKVSLIDWYKINIDYVKQDSTEFIVNQCLNGTLKISACYVKCYLQSKMLGKKI